MLYTLPPKKVLDGNGGDSDSDGDGCKDFNLVCILVAAKSML